MNTRITLFAATAILCGNIQAAVSTFDLNFEAGTWSGAAANGAGGGWKAKALTGTAVSSGITTSVTFGGTVPLASYSPAYTSTPQVEGFTLGSPSSESVDQVGDNLTHYISVDVSFSSPVWITSWKLGDLDAFWVTPDDREWCDEVFIEGFAGSTIGALGTGIDPTWSNIGSELFHVTDEVVDGYRSNFTTNGAPANDPKNQITFALGTETSPIQSFRLYYMSAGNSNIDTGHNIVLQEAPIEIAFSTVPEPSQSLCLAAGVAALVLRRRSKNR